MDEVGGERGTLRTLCCNAVFLAWADTKARYKKSVLGPWWMTLGNVIGVVGLGVVWSRLLGESLSSFLPSLTVGLVVWQLLSGSIVEASSVFVRHASIIRNVPMPTWFIALRGLTRHLINFAHNVLIIVVVNLVYGIPVTGATLLVIPGLVLVLANLLWVTYLLGLLGARFRDIEYAVTSFMPLLFFVTPVIFRPDHLGGAAVVWANPLTHFIEVVRSPIRGVLPWSGSWVVVVGFLVLGSTATLAAGRRYAHRLPYWV